MKCSFVWHRSFVAAACLASAAAVPPAHAVICPPGEPDFVYLDVGNDGCFNSGTDTEIPEASLVGTYTTSGSIVVPHGVKLEAPDGSNTDWHATRLYLDGSVSNYSSFSFDGCSIQIGASAKLIGNDVHFGMSGGVMIVGDGATLTAITGILTMTGSATTDLGASTHLSGASVYLDVDNDILVREGASIVGTNGYVSISMNAGSELQSGVSVAATGSLSITASSTLTLGDGVSLEGESSASISANGITAGDGVKMSGGTVTTSGSGDLVAGDKFSVEATDGVVTLGGGNLAVGEKARLTAATGLVVSLSGGVSFGASAKLSAYANISSSTGSTIDFGDKAKIVSTGGSVSLQGYLGVALGAKSKVSAFTSDTLISSAPNSGFGVQIAEGTKIKSGTAKDPMMPSSIVLEGYSIGISPKVSLSGAEKQNSIMLHPYETLSVDGAKIAGKTIVVGDADDAPFNPFLFKNTKVTGSADGATLDFVASGSTCDLTGSSFKKITVDHS